MQITFSSYSNMMQHKETTVLDLDTQFSESSLFNLNSLFIVCSNSSLLNALILHTVVCGQSTAQMNEGDIMTRVRGGPREKTSDDRIGGCHSSSRVSVNPWSCLRPGLFAATETRTSPKHLHSLCVRWWERKMRHFNSRLIHREIEVISWYPLC